jgi:putative ABC transport system ATP-binding protein
MSLLRMQNVTRTFGHAANAVNAIQGVSLQVEPGELVALMGPSGSGKSTLLALAGGLDSPTSGDVEICGSSLVSLNDTARARLRRRSVGYVFQDFNLIPALSAVENVALPLELGGTSSRSAMRAAQVALSEVGLAEFSRRYPDELSGGQQQRVAIARAIVGERQLILADEPTGALDSHTGEEVLRLLRERCNQGVSGVIVTHEARHAAWADRVVFIRDGRVVNQAESDLALAQAVL